MGIKKQNFRFQNLTRYLGDEQRKMMELWSDLQRVRKQCSEYREQTERDLENQRNEFIKVIRHVSGLVRGFNVEVIIFLLKNVEKKFPK